MAVTAEAIEAVYRTRYGPFRNALASVTGSYDSGHDAVQEGFARALARRGDYEGRGSLEAWIWRIALRAALELRGRPGGEAALVELPSAELVHPARDAELAAAIRALPPARRLVVFLRFVADLTYAEIAEICEISEGTVGATIAQARAALQEAMKEVPAHES